MECNYKTEVSAYMKNIYVILINLFFSFLLDIVSFVRSINISLRYDVLNYAEWFRDSSQMTCIFIFVYVIMIFVISIFNLTVYYRFKGEGKLNGKLYFFISMLLPYVFTVLTWIPLPVVR